MFETASIVDCLILVSSIKKELKKELTQNLIDALISFEATYDIPLPENVAEIIDKFYDHPVFLEEDRDSLENYIILLECDMMVSEEGVVTKTVLK